MSNEKRPATEESRKALYDNMGEIICGFSPILREWILIQRELELNNDNHKTYRALLSLCIFGCYFTIEMASVFRSSFRATLLAEKRYNIKYVNCVINEAYKSLYGFDKIDDNGKVIQKRSKLWKSKINNVLRTIDNSQLKQDLDTLEKLIIQLAEDGVADRERRNLSFHYDENPVSVYNMLIGLGEEEECQRMIRFMVVLDEVSKFVNRWIKKYSATVEVTSDYHFSLSEVDYFKNSKDKLLNVMGSAIETHSKGLDVAVLRQGIPDRLRQRFGDASEESIAVVCRITDLERAMMQLELIYIDIASASRAYLTAEHTIEKQLSLKQIVVIIYEGFNKLYGLNDKGEQNSFWARLIAPIVAENQEYQLQNDFNALTEEMMVLKSEIAKTKKQRQLFVHYDNGIAPVYDELQRLNPLAVFMQAKNIVEMLPKVIKFFTSCLQ